MKQMNQDVRFAFLYNPVFRVIATWIWFFVGAALVVLIILEAYGLDFTTALEVLGERRYLAFYIEFVSVGLFPLVITLICKDDPELYGLSRKGIEKSLLLSSLIVATDFCIGLLAGGPHFDSPTFHLNFPWNLWYVALGIFAYGPLEVFFVMWLITNTDRIFKSESRVLSWGLILTIIIFGALHILSSPTAGVWNAPKVGLIFLVLGLVYKYTKNSIGPIIAWTLINGQVWFIVKILWS
jgi:hypothetical protein